MKIELKHESTTEHTQGQIGIEWTETAAWVGPLRQDGSGKVSEIICSFDREGLTDSALAKNDANAKRMVVAWNCHDDLVAACKSVAEHLDALIK